MPIRCLGGTNQENYGSRGVLMRTNMVTMGIDICICFSVCPCGRGDHCWHASQEEYHIYGVQMINTFIIIFYPGRVWYLWGARYGKYGSNRFLVRENIVAARHSSERIW